MPVRLIASNFTAGELTQQLEGRIDLERYKHGAACLRNFVPKSFGGAARRAGTIFVGYAKFDAKRCRLIPFEFSRTVAYTLEVGDQYIRFWTARALLRAASSTPALTLTLGATSGFTVSATTSAPYWTDTATDRGRRITVGAATAEVKSVSSTTVASVAILVDFAGTVHGSGTWTITGTPVEVASPWLEAELPALRYEQIADVMYFTHQTYAPRKLARLTATSFQLTTPTFRAPATYEAGISLTLTGTDTLTLSAATVGTGRTATFAGAHAPFLPDADGSSDIGRTLTVSTGRAIISAVTSTTVATIDIIEAFSGTSLTSGTAVIGESPRSRIKLSGKAADIGIIVTARNNADSADVDTFRTSDVGKYLVLAGGVARIFHRVSATEVWAQVQQAFSEFTSDDGTTWVRNAGAWALESEAWSATRGYPGVVRLIDQRLVFAGSTAQPDTLWGSVVGDYENLARGVLDDEGFEYVIGANKINTIRWLHKLKRAQVAGTLGGEYTLSGAGSDEPISPGTPPLVENPTTWGADWDVDAIRAHQSILFVLAGGRRLREFSFVLEADGYGGSDVSLLAEHLLRDGVDEMAYVQRPESVVLLVGSDGELKLMTYDRSEQVIGWSHHVTGADQDAVDGKFESVCVTPNNCGTGDEVWLEVARVIGGGTKRYIEVMDGGVMTDSALSYSGTAATTFRGLAHLEGETVRAVAGGSTVYTTTVASGAISIAAAATAVEIGLPYTSRLMTLRPEWATGSGTAQGRFERWNRVVIRLFCTRGNVEINDEAVRYPSDATFPYTGDVDVLARGWDQFGRHTIEQPEPLPCTVLMVSGAVEIADA
jgi:hypothetical protein